MKKCIILILAMMSLFAHAETEIVDGIAWTYTVINGNAEIRGEMQCSEFGPAIDPETIGSITIPSKLGEYTVTSIGDLAFYGCSELTSVSIPSSVTSIGDLVFYGCSSLTCMTIPSSVTSIGWCAFHGCNSLLSVTIPPSVKNIGYSAFGGCSGLGSGVIIRDGWVLTVVGDYPEAVIIPNGVKGIAGAAFSYCSRLTSVTIPASVTSIGDGAFESCSSLTSVAIPASVTSIGDGVFESCLSLTSVTIPSGVESIGDDAFSNCSSLERVVIPSGVTRIGERAFSYCSGLTSVIIPPSVASIGIDAFSCCDGLGGGVIIRGGWVLTVVGDCPDTVIIPDGVKGIVGGAFSGYSGLTSVTIPSSVSSIGGCAFSGCRELASVTIPSSVVSVGGCAFDGADSLSEVRVCVGDSLRMLELFELSGYDTSSLTFVEDPDLDPFTVIFDSQEGICAEELRKVEKGKTVGSLPAPIRGQYKFDGWYTEATGGTKVSASTKVTRSVTYYAHWIYNGLSMVAGVVGRGCLGMGTVSGGKSAKGGTKVTLKATANKGYVFAGWYWDVDMNERFEDGIDWRTPSVSLVIDAEDVVLYAKFIPVSEDWAFVDCGVQDEYETKLEIDPIRLEVDGGSLPTVKVTGTLPAGLKFTAKELDIKETKTTPGAHYEANTIYGTPTKSGVYNATITVTTAGKATATKEIIFKVLNREAGENFLLTEFDAQMGKVTGAGIYTAYKKVTLKATANKGFVFAGWYADPEFMTPLKGTVDYRTALFPYSMPGEDTVVYAKFLPSAEDEEIELRVDDTYYTSGAFELYFDIDSHSVPKVSFSGLPSGIKFDSKSNRIAGMATSPGTYLVTAKLTNTTVKKAIERKFTIIVDNLTGANELVRVLDAEGGEISLLNAREERYEAMIGVQNSTLPARIAAANEGDKVSVSGLPSGFKYDTKTGVISGMATKAGVYTAQVKVTSGKSTFVSTFTVDVASLPTWAVGSFDGEAMASADLWTPEPHDYLGVSSLTVSSAGKISGKISLANVKAIPFTFDHFTSFDGNVLTASGRIKWDSVEFIADIVVGYETYTNTDENDPLCGSARLELYSDKINGNTVLDNRFRVSCFYAQNIWASKLHALPVLDTKSTFAIAPDEESQETYCLKFSAKGVATVSYWSNLSSAKATRSGSVPLLLTGYDADAGAWNGILVLNALANVGLEEEKLVVVEVFIEANGDVSFSWPEVPAMPLSWFAGTYTGFVTESGDLGYLTGSVSAKIDGNGKVTATLEWSNGVKNTINCTCYKEVYRDFCYLTGAVKVNGFTYYISIELRDDGTASLEAESYGLYYDKISGPNLYK